MSSGPRHRQHLHESIDRAKRQRERKRTLGGGSDLATPAGGLPEAQFQYQVIRADADLNWIADWVRAH